jgi:SPP1 family predicted phage head-tail adaptor
MDRQGKKSNATEMRHYIVIQSNTSTTDEEGGFTENWSDGETVAAAIYPISAQQQFNFKSVNVDATHYIKIRGEITIAEADRIKFENEGLTRYFEILTIENIQERDIEKFITCKETR